MGIYIRLDVSYAVTKEEWEKTYEEALKLAKAFPLAELRMVPIDGIKTLCFVKPDEYTELCRYGGKRTGFNVDGDYTYLKVSENYFLPKYLVDEDKAQLEIESEDALFGTLTDYLDYSWGDKRFDTTYSLWGAKTQGRPCHLYLVAIGCLIEARLGAKAFLRGDITRGQCVKAVEMANELLEEPIQIPDRCDSERFLKRVQALPLTDVEKLGVYSKCYLGDLEEAVSRCARNSFSDDVWDKYWKKRFSYYNVNQIGFQDIFSDYLSWGFNLERMCSYVNYQDKGGTLLYDRFVNMVMDAKLYVKNKDCSDPLRIDQNESSPYGVSTQFAQFLFAGARNMKVPRYMPIEEIRCALRNGIGEKCDTDGLIDEYLIKEEGHNNSHASKLSGTDIEAVLAEGANGDLNLDESDIFKQWLDQTEKMFQEEALEYDITEADELMFFKKGNVILPGLQKCLKNSFRFYHGATEEERFSELMKGSVSERCTYLVSQNKLHGHPMLLRDVDWKRIFDDIALRMESFQRYYPMVRVKITSDDARDMIRAFVINDELYEYCVQLLKEE